MRYLGHRLPQRSWFLCGTTANLAKLAWSVGVRFASSGSCATAESCLMLRPQQPAGFRLSVGFLLMWILLWRTAVRLMLSAGSTDSRSVKFSLWNTLMRVTLRSELLLWIEEHYGKLKHLFGWLMTSLRGYSLWTESHFSRQMNDSCVVSLTVKDKVESSLQSGCGVSSVRDKVWQGHLTASLWSSVTAVSPDVHMIEKLTVTTVQHVSCVCCWKWTVGVQGLAQGHLSL